MKAPRHARADLTLEWPTWSQAAYRSWYIDEELTELPRIDIEVVLRVQRLVSQPEPSKVLAALPIDSPEVSGERLHRSGPTVETVHSPDMTESQHAFEVSYEGSYELDEAALADGSILDDHFGAVGGWISSTLVKLGDLDLEYLPPSEPDD
ncbi:MAG: hypothetical protein M5U19_10695 [Microthrixaceae bacterium]|nr:hypothetical protein [Microthrixaceae bacterium]